MKLVQSIWPRLWLPLLFLIAMWILELSEQVLAVSFSHYGVLPRSTDGIYGIFFSPFLHGEWQHILSNSLPFIVLSSILFLAYRKVSYTVFIAIYILTGIFVWLFARSGTYHIGASGLVYGLFGFIFFSGIFRMDIKSIALSLIVAFFYGGMVYGVFPGQPGISWESHLLGAFAGAILAYHFKNVQRSKPPKFMEEPEERKTFEDFIQKIK
jgi:membrane associated rhomboid family serine protease